jgi:hypothetical protein
MPAGVSICRGENGICLAVCSQVIHGVAWLGDKIAIDGNYSIDKLNHIPPPLEVGRKAFECN